MYVPPLLNHLFIACYSYNLIGHIQYHYLFDESQLLFALYQKHMKGRSIELVETVFRQ